MRLKMMRLKMKKFFLLIAMAFFATSNVNAGIYNVSNTEELNNAINSVSDGDTIKIAQNILLTNDLDTITKSITITAGTDNQGRPFVVSGNQQQFKTFIFAKQSNSKVENITIQESGGGVYDGGQIIIAPAAIKVIDSASIIVNNLFTYNNDVGIYFESVGNYNIDNFSSMYDLRGIVVENSNRNKNYIRNSTFRGGTSGIRLSGTNVEINNIVLDDYIYGIELIIHGDTNKSVNAVIENITITNIIIRDGIVIDVFCNAYINNATIKYSSSDRGSGINIFGNCVLCNSTIGDNAGTGVRVSGGHSAGNVLISNCTISRNANQGIAVICGKVSIINTTVTNNGNDGLTTGRYWYSSDSSDTKILVSNSIFYDNSGADFSDSSYPTSLNIFNSVYKTYKGKQPDKIENCSQENPLLVAKYKENENLIEYYLPQSGSSAINLADSRFASEDFLTKFDGEHFLDLPNNFNRANYFDSLLNYDQIGSKRKIENGKYTAGSIDYNTSGISANFVTAMDIEVFPNPAENNIINFRFNLQEAGNTKLTISNVMGQVVAIVVDGYCNASEYTFANFNISDLPTGAYYYTLTSNSRTTTKMFNIIR